MKPPLDLPTFKAANGSPPGDELHGPAFQTNAVYVIFTGADDTIAALDAATAFAAPVGAAVTLLHFREVPYPQPLDAPAGISPVETETFVARVRAERLNVTTRVYLCRDARSAIAGVLNRPSLVFVGQHRSWRRYPLHRLRAALQRVGHSVVVVNASAIKEPVHA
jgi:hypothetical protein